MACGIKGVDDGMAVCFEIAAHIRKGKFDTIRLVGELGLAGENFIVDAPARFGQGIDSAFCCSCQLQIERECRSVKRVDDRIAACGNFLAHVTKRPFDMRHLLGKAGLAGIIINLDARS